MSADIVTATHKQVTHTMQTEHEGFMGMLIKASSNGATIEQIAQLLELNERHERREAEKAFNADFAALTADIEPIVKNGKVILQANKGYTFAKFEDIDAAIRPALAAHGFAISFDQEQREGGGSIIIGTLSHRDGHSKTSRMALALDSGQARNPNQAAGSTLTYGRRYVTAMLLNLAFVEEDNDANAKGIIGRDTAEQIEALLTETGADRANFLAVYGAESVEVLPASCGLAALNMLAKKRKPKS